MSTPAQIGKNEYQAALAKGRGAQREIRKILKRIMHESGSSLVQALTGKVALELGEIDEALERLDEIGKTLKESNRSV